MLIPNRFKIKNIILLAGGCVAYTFLSILNFFLLEKPRKIAPQILIIKSTISPAFSVLFGK